MFIILLFSSSLIIKIGSLLALLHELIKIQGHFPLEGEPYQLVILIYHFHDFTVQVRKELTHRWGQNLPCFCSSVFWMWSKAFY